MLDIFSRIIDWVLRRTEQKKNREASKNVSENSSKQKWLQEMAIIQLAEIKESQKKIDNIKEKLNELSNNFFDHLYYAEVFEKLNGKEKSEGGDEYKQKINKLRGKIERKFYEIKRSIIELRRNINLLERKSCIVDCLDNIDYELKLYEEKTTRKISYFYYRTEEEKIVHKKISDQKDKILKLISDLIFLIEEKQDEILKI